MGRIRKILRFSTLFLLVPGTLAAQAPRPGGGVPADFLRDVSEYFNVDPQEVAVLSRWDMAPAEIPVVLFLSGRTGVSSDVVIARRQRGRDWIDIAEGFGLHAGDFYVRLNGSPGFLAGVYDRYAATSPMAWHEVQLTDRELTALVNIRFISRFLSLPPEDVIRALENASGVVPAYRALRRGTSR